MSIIGMVFLAATSIMFAAAIACPQWAWVAVLVWLSIGVYAAGESS